MKEIIIEGMSCNHCVMKVTKAFEKANIRTITVVVNNATVDEDDDAKITSIIEQLGYTVKEIR